jgi:cell division protein FtsQ
MWHSAWNDAATLNRVSALLVVFALGVFATMAIKWLAARPVFAIQRVVVTGGMNHADPAHIAAVVHQGLRGTFFTMDLSAARDALQKVPWVRHVSARRQWPGSLEIAVEEHQPLARWNETALVNIQGEVFEAEYGEELPDFYGPDGTAAEVTARYREFSAPLRNVQLGIDALSRSARGAWDVKLDDGMTIALGREQVGERWARWMQVSERYRDRIAQGGQLAAVDMRYPNGFAARIIGGGKNAAAGAKAGPAKRG